VLSPNWDSGINMEEVGAVTWCNGNVGAIGEVNSTNSLVGSKPGDYIGNNGVTTLANGNYLVVTPDWDNGTSIDAGAVTWCSGTAGISGVISSSNSLVGTFSGDYIGNNGIVELLNGNFVVLSPNWSNSRGAVTWGSGGTGIAGEVNSNNSLVGSSIGDGIGSQGVVVLVDGNYIIRSSGWDNSGVGGIPGGRRLNFRIPNQLSNNNGTISDAGAVTWGNGSTGVSGFINSCNSITGNSVNNGIALAPEYNFKYNYLLVSKKYENIISVYYPDGMTIANQFVNASANINGLTSVPLINNSCLLIATIRASGTKPVSGYLEGKVWIDGSIQVYNELPYVQRHYEITPVVNSDQATAKITLYFTQNEFDSFNAHPNSSLNLPVNSNDIGGKSNLRVIKFPGNSSDETGLPNSYSKTPEVIDPVDAEIVWNHLFNRWEVSFNVSGFGGYIIQTMNSILPFKLISFYASKKNTDVVLEWKTAEDLELSHYVIERGSNSFDFKSIGEVGTLNSLKERTYSYNDINALVYYGNHKQLYYRLRIVQKDENIEYSNIRRIELNKKLNISLYPNPVQDFLTIRVLGNNMKDLQIRLTDLQGRIIKNLSYQKTGTEHLWLKMSNLQKGFYFLEILQNNDVKDIFKVIKQ
jgi:hypothetical protein